MRAGVKDDEFIDVKVYIYDQQDYHLSVIYPDHVSDRVAGILSMGVEGNEPGTADDCIEFYQGPGLTRFRAI